MLSIASHIGISEEIEGHTGIVSATGSHCNIAERKTLVTQEN